MYKGIKIPENKDEKLEKIQELDLGLLDEELDIQCKKALS